MVAVLLLSSCQLSWLYIDKGAGHQTASCKLVKLCLALALPSLIRILNGLRASGLDDLAVNRTFMASFFPTYTSTHHSGYGTPDSSPRQEHHYSASAVESQRGPAAGGYFPAFARSVTAASQVKPVSSAALLLAALAGGPESPPQTPQRPFNGFDNLQTQRDTPSTRSASLMSAINLPFPATTGKASARSWVGAISRRAASRRSLKTYRKVILSLAAVISLFYLYNEVYPTAGNPGWSNLLPRPAGPKVFAFTEPRLAHSQDHLVSYVESHVNGDEYLAQSDPSFPPQAPQGLSFVDTDDLEEQQGEFGYFAEDEMLEDGGETDEASHRATKEADQMSSAEKERRTQRKLEHALEIVAKRQEAGQSPGRSLTSLADRNGLPEVYLEAIHAHTEIDISHPDVTAEQVARLIDIVDHTRHLTLRTLIWYLTRGLKLAIGDGPAEMDTLMKSIWSVGGGRGLEIALKHAEEEGQGVGTRLEDRVFWEGWQDAAEQEGHIAIFSKVSSRCKGSNIV